MLIHRLCKKRYKIHVVSTATFVENLQLLKSDYMKYVLIVICIIALNACGGTDKPANNGNNNGISAPAQINYTVVNTYPHDTSSFTEGLVWFNNFLYEGTGNYGKSKLLKTDLKTGKIVQQASLENQYFGEGISIMNNKIYQLTYREQKVFVYDVATFKKTAEFSWETGEGWGMTTDGKQLILTNSGSNLYYINPVNFSISKVVGVTDNYGPVGAINELEYVDGFIYANVYPTDVIIKINPETGKVEGKIDMGGLLEKTGKATGNEDVLNGIAYNAATKSFYITGKFWPLLFEIKLN